MKVLITNHNPFTQEVYECDNILEAVAYDAGLDVEDFEGDDEQDGWVQNEHGIFISDEDHNASFVIIG